MFIIAAKEIHPMYGQTSFDAIGTFSKIKYAYIKVNNIITINMNRDKRYFSELNTLGHKKFSAI